MRSLQEDIDARVAVRMQAREAQIRRQYEAAIDALNESLDTTNAQLREEHEEKLVLEEDMKQAFMRSVCALNIEAISVMNRKTSGGGGAGAAPGGGGGGGGGGGEDDEGKENEGTPEAGAAPGAGCAPEQQGADAPGGAPVAAAAAAAEEPRDANVPRPVPQAVTAAAYYRTSAKQAEG